jgi:hypothetical protein
MPSIEQKSVFSYDAFLGVRLLFDFGALGFVLAKQMLYHLGHSSPKMSVDTGKNCAF